MNCLRQTCAALLLASPLFAQNSAAPARLHIPAGTWSVRDLLTHAEQALRTPILADANELALADAAPVRLQVELTLDPELGREALSALLGTRGVLLTRSEGGQIEARATPRGTPEWLLERAVPTKLLSLLEHPHRDSVVRVELQTTQPIGVLTSLLGFTAATGGATPICTPIAGGIACTGTSDAVLGAVTQLAAVDPQFAAMLKPLPPMSILGSARSVTVELKAGAHPLPELVDLLAKSSGINVVMSPAVAACATKVEMEKARSLDFRTGADTLTTLLWANQVLLLELDVRHGLYEAVLVENQRQMPALVRASRRTVEEALEATNCVMYVAVPWQPEHLDADASMVIVRNAVKSAAPGIGTLLVLGVPDGLLLAGLSPQVAALLRELRAADKAQRG